MGILIIKYEGGNADPIATATVYYTQQGKAFGSSLPTFRVGPNGTTTQSLEAVTEQTLVGLRNDGSYRFNVSLFNASSSSGFYQLTAFGDDGAPVSLLDETGASVATRQFPIGAFQQVLLQSGDLGLTDPAKRYVLKASPVSSSGGGLIAAASALDRRNNDLVQVSDDTPRITAAADALVDYFIPGVGRIGRDDVADGPHWKTDLTLYSSSSVPRDLTFEYRYTDGLGVEQRVLAPVTVGAGKSVILDDVVGSILARYAPSGVDLNTESTLGLLRISYRAATDSSTAPLLIGGRIYDDRGASGTAGMQLFVYSNGESVSPGSPLVLPGAQQNLRFRTNIGFFCDGRPADPGSSHGRQAGRRGRRDIRVPPERAGPLRTLRPGLHAEHPRDRRRSDDDQGGGAGRKPGRRVRRHGRPDQLRQHLRPGSADPAGELGRVPLPSKEPRCAGALFFR